MEKNPKGQARKQKENRNKRILESHRVFYSGAHGYSGATAIDEMVHEADLGKLPGEENREAEPYFGHVGADFAAAGGGESVGVRRHHAGMRLIEELVAGVLRHLLSGDGEEQRSGGREDEMHEGRTGAVRHVADAEVRESLSRAVI